MGFRRSLVTPVVICATLLVAGCGREQATPPGAATPNVTTVTVAARDVPISAEFVAQTQSSQAVNIQARVSGFLDKRVYTEGAVVQAGQVLYQMDAKPFQAQLDAAKAALQRNQAAAAVAKANLDRTRPLAQQNALSQKDLDDATGQYEQSNAAVAQSQAQVDEAELNLSYTTIRSPVTGVSSYSAIAEGTYVSPTNAQLTTVSVLSPMWVNFSLSENEMARIRAQQKSGELRMPATGGFDAEIELVDGSVFPSRGHITFADPSYNSQTGTFLIRVSVPNPQGLLRPNQYVRVHLYGASRPNAILVPQRAVQQNAKGHFVWTLDGNGAAQIRPVEVGDWNGDDWFITQGLVAGDVVIVDGTLRLAPGIKVNAKPYVPPPAPPQPAAAAAAAAGATVATPPPGASGTAAIDMRAPPAAGAATANLGSVRFATGSAALDASAASAVTTIATVLKSATTRVAITGYTDRTGDHAANVALAKARALAVRDALVAAGIAADRLQLREPLDIIGSGSNDEARRVDVITLG
ncbi:MAG: efflux RND transporter periplasmic adaptor subunit [Proteobacteria bacterium]|nr:efflux RND transporter periplasmic adaptor subunit [Pseudomonadota bacterium]